MGVFAGRAFKKDEIVLMSWMTLLLPENIVFNNAVWNYVFGHNETHSALALDYGSVANHHESANTRAVHVLGHNLTYEKGMHFQVRRGV